MPAKKVVKKVVKKKKEEEPAPEPAPGQSCRIIQPITTNFLLIMHANFYSLSHFFITSEKKVKSHFIQMELVNNFSIRIEKS